MDLYLAINVLTIPLLHEMQLLILIHKCSFHKHLMPEIFQHYYEDNGSVHHYNTRRNTDLHMYGVNTTFGQRCSIYRGSRLWNNLPTNLKMIMFLPIFKTSVKMFLFEKIV